MVPCRLESPALLLLSPKWFVTEEFGADDEVE